MEVLAIREGDLEYPDDRRLRRGGLARRSSTFQRVPASIYSAD